MQAFTQRVLLFILVTNLHIMPREVTRPKAILTDPSQDLTGKKKVVLYPDLARESFIYLNEFRNSPAIYGKKIGLDLRRIASARLLTWDPLLAEAAGEKAAEMASENYFGHIDLQGKGMNYRVYRKGYLLPAEWTRNAAANYIESIAANSKDPRHFIDQLIIDKGVQDKAHRQHLLGTTHFYSNASRIGIAIAYSRESAYKYYCCILIAPRFAEVKAEEAKK